MLSEQASQWSYRAENLAPLWDVIFQLDRALPDADFRNISIDWDNP